MGIKSCSRKDCDNIMCNRYSQKFGYICDECFEELKCSHVPISVFMSVAKIDLPSYNYDEEFKNPKER